MTDKKLLKLAAKAAGFTLDDEICTDEWLVIFSKVQDPLFGDPETLYWNPLTCNDDAFRLAVDLGIFTAPSDFFLFWSVQQFKADPYAATRRAITLAAAEIGKDMP